MESKILGRELENVTNLFISSNNGGNSPAKGSISVETPVPAVEEDGIDVEETVHIRKKMAYPPTRKAQEELRKYLFERIQENYTISRIELKKTTDIFTQQKKTTREEEIVVLLKEG